MVQPEPERGFVTMSALHAEVESSHAWPGPTHSDKCPTKDRGPAPPSGNLGGVATDLAAFVRVSCVSP